MLPYRLPLWRSAPMLRMLAALIAGIILQQYTRIQIPVLLAVSCLLVIFFLAYYCCSLTVRFRFRKIHSIILWLLCVQSGMLLIWKNDLRNDSCFFMKHYRPGFKILLRVTEPMQDRTNSFSGNAAVLAVFNKDTSFRTTGQLHLVIEKDSLSKAPDFGDCLIAAANLHPVKNEGNPGEFDKERYYEAARIYHEAYLRSTQYKNCGNHSSDPLKKWVYDLRAATLELLRRFIPTARNLGIAEALLIGYRNDLDKDLVRSYSQTGVVHIIAISGLHLGLIYTVLLFLLGKIPLMRSFSRLQYLILLCCLWIFSLMTGASASVLRSAVMFTCIIAGKWLKRESSITNSLAASAFILLLYDPLLLWDAGFLLSYSAVAGIVMYQQLLMKPFVSSCLPVRKLSEMSSVTIAATIMTFPVSVFFFHQFPVYFLFSNLVAVPLSTVILFEEIALVCLSCCKPVAVLLGKLIDVSVGCMNEWILMVGRMPHALIDDIHADVKTTLALYLFVIFFTAAFSTNKKNRLLWSLFFLSLFTSLQTIAAFDNLRQTKVIVYSIPGTHHIDLIHGKNCTGLSADTTVAGRKISAYYLNSSRKSLGIAADRNGSGCLYAVNRIFVFHNRTIAVIDSSFRLSRCRFNGKVDLMVMVNTPRVSLTRLTEKIRPGVLIFAGSNKLWKIAKWKKEADSLHLHCFSTGEEGAYAASLQ